MTLGAVLRKIFMVDILTGMSVTFRHQKQADVITEQYPLERPVIAERYRGQPRLAVDPETGETLCNGCGMCVTACPEKLITVTSERDPETKKKKMTTYTLDLSRCMFCGLCQEACPTDCIELTQDYEMALYSREGMVLSREQLEQGPKPTVYVR
ncbi:MAG TPA: NADH-quinone oxidoreductase subunit I [Clostridia bacterium]|nr:NADH-quinone oxidoreductase subunit I [Clostridia bacterium]